MRWWAKSTPSWYIARLSKEGLRLSSKLRRGLVDDEIESAPFVLGYGDASEMAAMWMRLRNVRRGERPL